MAEDCRRDRNQNDDHHLQRQQPTSQSHSRVHASNVTVRKKTNTRDPPWSRSFEGRMLSRLDRNAHFLRLLASSKPSVKKQLVEHTTKDQMDMLSELVFNLLSGVIPLEASSYNKLIKRRQKLRALAKKKGSMKRTKQLLVR